MHYNNTSDYDYPEIYFVKTSYIVCSIPRSGSTLLCRGLWQTGLAGAPKEYFNKVHMNDFVERWQPTTIEEYIHLLKVHRTSPNGIFGVKAHLHQYQKVKDVVERYNLFPDLRFISVKRRDHLRQAVSYVKALQTGQWSSDDPSSNATVYNYDEIRKKRREIEDEEAGWEKFFKLNRIQPYPVIYEDLVKNYQSTIREILELLGVILTRDFQVKPPQIKKLSDEVTEDWLIKYTKHEQALQEAGNNI